VYGCGTWSLTQRQEQKLSVFQCKVLTGLKERWSNKGESYI